LSDDEQPAFDREEKKCCFESYHEDIDFVNNDDDATSSPRGEIGGCVCQKKSHRELLCACCNATFRSCCEGYSREPIDCPIYSFTGAKVALRSFCSRCVVAKGVTQEVVLAQEDEYFALVKYFEPAAGRGWRWIPGICDEFSMFSVIWLHLQQSEFLYSPLFCGIGTAFDGVRFQKDPQYMSFISHCAEEALGFVQAKGDWAEYVKVWSAIRSNPESMPEYLGSEALTYVGSAIAMYLKYDPTPSVIRVWQLDESSGLLGITASFGSKHEWAQKIDVLMRNSRVETRYDLIVPRHELTDSMLF
jgi:hypothetical protein